MAEGRVQLETLGGSVRDALAALEGEDRLSATSIQGLGTSAELPSSAFATAAQGQKADTAVQPDQLTIPNIAGLEQALDDAASSGGGGGGGDVPSTRTITGDGTYIEGGGSLAANRVLSPTAAMVASLGKADTALQAGDVGTAAAQNIEAFATAAQGGLADTALQDYSGFVAETGLGAGDIPIVNGTGDGFEALPSVVITGATRAEVAGGDVDKILTGESYKLAGNYLAATITPGTPDEVDIDLDAGINFSATLDGDSELQLPTFTGADYGRSGMLNFVISGTGEPTLTKVTGIKGTLPDMPTGDGDSITVGYWIDSLGNFVVGTDPVVQA